ncbi:MAG: hypothetical protein IIZ13_08120 [Renibacterium sp.]|nr:hypothetical protein [Renibacterium sp.]
MTTFQNDTTPETETFSVELLAKQCVLAEEMVEAWTNKVKALKELLVAFGVGSHDAGDYTVQVRAGAKRFDAKAAEKAYPAAENPVLYKTVLDPEAFKTYLAPIVVEQFKIEGKPTVVIK